MTGQQLVVMTPEQLAQLVKNAVAEALREHAHEGQGQHVTVAEAARRLAVNPKTIHRRIRAGELQAIRIGRAVRVSLEGLAVGEEQLAQLAREARTR
jgi:excisionase family DNA binding protein